MKPRILIHSEYSQLHTGYGVNARELLIHLYKSGKYEVAEFARFAGPHNFKKQPWPVYCNEPFTEEERKTYNSHPHNKHGRWRFERVLLDFLPTHIVTLSDVWMDKHVYHSVYRPYYHLIGFSPVDSSPQNPDWFYDFSLADALFTLTEWGVKVLKEEGGGIVNAIGDAPAGAPPEFRPMDKVTVREKWGLDKDAFIIGTVMRNQRRKLFPDLFAAFRQTLDKLPSQIADKVSLLAYTAYPDLGWNVPQLLNEFGLTHKVFFIYKCQQCKYIFPSYFADAVTGCYRCKQKSAVMCRVSHGLDNQGLAEVYNLMDLYIQYANAEGLAFPQIEAAACGTPFITVDHSAMAEVGRKLGAWLVNPITQIRDTEITAYRAAPNNQELVDLLVKIIQLPKDYLQKRGLKCKEATDKYYPSWANTVQKYIDYIDSTPLTGKQGKWDSAPQIYQPNTNIPNIPSNDNFIKWCILNILNDPSLLFTKKHIDWVCQLNLKGKISPVGQVDRLERKDLVKLFMDMIKSKNHAEQARVQRDKLPQPNYIELAHK